MKYHLETLLYEKKNIKITDLHFNFENYIVLNSNHSYFIDLEKHLCSRNSLVSSTYRWRLLSKGSSPRPAGNTRTGWAWCSARLRWRVCPLSSGTACSLKTRRNQRFQENHSSRRPCATPGQVNHRLLTAPKLQDLSQQPVSNAPRIFPCK